MTDWKALANKQILEMLGGHVEFPEVDHRLRYLIKNFASDRLTVMEFGCWHGWHTVPLARSFGHVTALDVRPDNIAKALLRFNLLGLRNVDAVIGNVDEADFKADVLVHVGVLYHLFNPVAHLHRVLPKCNILCLDTHINKPGLKEAVEVYAGQPYRGGVYKEHGWNDPLSGVEETSLWLEDEELRRVVQDCGFGVVHEHYHEAPTGKRLTLVAVRTLFA